MRFWDTSALMPLLIRESTSQRLELMMEKDPVVIAAFFTPVEVSSVLWRQRHAGRFDMAAHHHVEATFARISREWLNVDEPQKIVAALIARDTLRERFSFVTLDQELATAALGEAFVVLP